MIKLFLTSFVNTDITPHGLRMGPAGVRHAGVQPPKLAGYCAAAVHQVPRRHVGPAPVRWNLNQMYLGQYDPSPSAVVGSNCTENNFGVFADFHIQVAAWLALARDMRGEGVNTAAICNGAIQYTDTTTGPPLMGCYELAFMPLSWFGPE